MHNMLVSVFSLAFNYHVTADDPYILSMIVLLLLPVINVIAGVCVCVCVFNFDFYCDLLFSVEQLHSVVLSLPCEIWYQLGDSTKVICYIISISQLLLSVLQDYRKILLLRRDFILDYFDEML